MRKVASWRGLGRRCQHRAVVRALRGHISLMAADKCKRGLYRAYVQARLQECPFAARPLTSTELNKLSARATDAGLFSAWTLRFRTHFTVLNELFGQLHYSIKFCNLFTSKNHA